MKKNSKKTAEAVSAVKPAEATEQQGPYWIGLDLGDRTSRFCMLNERSKVVERGSVATRKEDLTRMFGRYAGNAIALEVGSHSPWVSRLLGELKLDVVVANPRKVKLIAQSRKKSDDKDAEELARLLKADRQLLSPVVHRSAQAQTDLLVIRARATAVEMRTKVINSMHGLAKSVGQRLPVSDASLRKVDQVESWPEEYAVALRPLLTIASALTLTIKVYDEEIAKNAEEKYPEVALLRQIPGVGPVTATAYVLTLDDPSKFKNSRQVGAFLGMTPARRQSSDSDPQMGISREGDVYLRALLVQCAHLVMGKRGPDCELKRFGMKIAGMDEIEGTNKRKAPNKKRMKVAVVAVARKLGVLMHRLWVSGENYHPFYNVKQKEKARKVAA